MPAGSSVRIGSRGHFVGAVHDIHDRVDAVAENGVVAQSSDYGGVSAAVLANRRVIDTGAHKTPQGRREFANLPLDARHEVRLLVKKLRYATDFFEGLYPAKPEKKYIRCLHKLQDELSYLNDIVTLNSILERILERSGGAKAQRTAGFLIGWYEREVASGDARLADDWKRFEKSTPFWY